MINSIITKKELEGAKFTASNYLEPIQGKINAIYFIAKFIQEDPVLEPFLLEICKFSNDQRLKTVINKALNKEIIKPKSRLEKLMLEAEYEQESLKAFSYKSQYLN